MATSHILILLTSNSALGTTGFYYEEMATPYYCFMDKGCIVTLASIQGGTPPYDPDSLPTNAASVQRFLADREAMRKLADTPAIAELNPDDYAAIFLAGGHGTMGDFPDNPHVAGFITRLHARQAVIGAVCHGPAGLIGALNPDNTPLVKNRHINSFTNEEEKHSGKGALLPFLLENRLRELGAIFESSLPFKPCIVQDGNIVTGQNPASAEGVAETILQLLKGTNTLHSEPSAA